MAGGGGLPAGVAVNVNGGMLDGDADGGDDGEEGSGSSDAIDAAEDEDNA